MRIDDLYADIMATTGAANTREFESAFLRALASVINDLNNKLGTSILAPDDIDQSDVGFESYADNTFHPGCKFYMQRAGQWAQDPDGESYTFYQQQLRSVIGAAILEIDDFQTR